jgi:hypothetical protein
MFNILAILVIVIVWLDFLFLVAVLAGMMESKPARPRPKPCRSRHNPRLVTIKPARFASADHQASVSPLSMRLLRLRRLAMTDGQNGDNWPADPADRWHQSPIPTERGLSSPTERGLSSPTERGLYIDELMYHAMERFEDPEGDL